MSPRRTSIAAVAVCLATVAVPVTAQAGAPSSRPLAVSQSTVVNTIPATYSPDVTDGIVFSIAQTGSTVVLGGSFTSIAPHASSATVAADGAAAFIAGTGSLVTGFAPDIKGGNVKAVLAGPSAGTVYVGGEFATIDGIATRVALLDASTGAIVPGWTSPTFDGDVTSLVAADGRLFVGGDFTTVAGQSRVGMAVLDATTGALSNYDVPTFTGHHNYITQCDPAVKNCAKGPTGVRSMDITPSGTKLAAIGNFTDVSGTHSDQIAMLDLSDTAATLDTSWATDAYTSGCARTLFDSYVRDVQFSPDGSYFVVAATGAGGQVKNSDGTQSNCDAASRFETDATGTDIAPTWVDHTGNDTFLSVALTGTVAYLGGHERWVNNSTGDDSPQEGAVPRPGIVALDPANGMPLKWNPGRNPRGAGAWSLLATPFGLYVGSDTDYIGDRLYLRKKIAFFPLAGGATLATNSAYSLPGNVVMIGGPTSESSARAVTWDGSAAPSAPATVGSVDWTTARGAFEINNTVYYGTSDGGLFRRSFNGTTFGSPIAIDPYDDPTWQNVQTGSGQTYRGVKSNFYNEIPTLTSMFYAPGRLFYTVSGDSDLHWRWFEPDSGTVGADEFKATSAVDWSTIEGAFLSGSDLYFATASDGNLHHVAFSGTGTTGTTTTADSSIDWRGAGSFVAAATQTVPNEPPTATFAQTCHHLTCGFSAAASRDLDGTITDYSWDWGDGTTSAHTDATPTHTFAKPGDYVVTLTVTDNDGATNAVSARLTINPPPYPVFVGGVTGFGIGHSLTVKLPSTIHKGDLMVLFASEAASSQVSRVPASWVVAGDKTRAGLTTTIYSRIAHSSAAGKPLTVHFDAKRKAAVTVVVYSGATGIESTTMSSDRKKFAHKSPTIKNLAPGSLVLTYWSGRAPGGSQWLKPANAVRRASVISDRGVGSLLIDSNAGESGRYVGSVARTKHAVRAAVKATIGLVPKP